VYYRRHCKFAAIICALADALEKGNLCFCTPPSVQTPYGTMLATRHPALRSLSSRRRLKNPNKENTSLETTQDTALADRRQVSRRLSSRRDAEFLIKQKRSSGRHTTSIHSPAFTLQDPSVVVPQCRAQEKCSNFAQNVRVPHR
jgi:hypothetical protein